MQCEYGCGNTSSYIINNKNCCSKHYNSCPAIRTKNSDGCKRAYNNGRAHRGFTVEAQENSNKKAIQNAIQKAFTKNSYYTNDVIKRYLIEHYKWEYVCSECNLVDWNDKPINLELDHINGVSSDNRLINLRFLCLNCHSQTPTFRGRNINTGQIKVTDAELIDALQCTKNIRQALILVKLAPKGGNYNRAKKLLNK